MTLRKTTHWRHELTVETIDGERAWGIREVYYDGDAVVAWTKDPIPVYGDSEDDIVITLERMTAATTRPPLDLDAEAKRLGITSVS